MADHPPEPEPQPLLRAFDYVYLTFPTGLWDLTPHARSIAVMRRVFAVSRSFRMPPRLNVATHPHVDPAEYGTMAALASATDADIDACVTAYHAKHAGHPYPAALFDPAGRTGQSEPGRSRPARQQAGATDGARSPQPY
jgi:hypothetical protein